MPEVEIPSLVIVVLYLVLLARREGFRAWRRLAVLSACGLLTEHTVVDMYGFYTYSPRWSLFVGHVPLLVGVIWPVVIDSAQRIATHILGPESAGVPFLAAAIVAADAGLIEPIAVNAGLWRWHEPGVFDVPIIGMIGWGVFAYMATRVLTPRSGLAGNAVHLLLTVAATHVALIALWYLALRFFAWDLPVGVCIAAVWLACVTAAVWVRTRVERGVPVALLGVRSLAAAFFFWLLLSRGAGPALWVWSLAFPLPYLALVIGLRPGRRTSEGSVGSARH